MPVQNRYCEWGMHWVEIEDELAWDLHRERCLKKWKNPPLKMYDWEKEEAIERS